MKLGDCFEMFFVFRRVEFAMYKVGAVDRKDGIA